MAHRRRPETGTPTDKTCASCGRRIEWRHKWADTWDDVRYCSAACRRRGVTPQDEELEERILGLLASRAVLAEADVTGDEPDQREPVRRAARRLVARGAAVLVQRGTVVDPSTAKGPVQIRRP